MYYICARQGDLFGIRDTSDNVVEYYNRAQIDELVKSGIKIYGVFKPNKKTLLITVYSEWNNFEFLSKKDIMKMRLAGQLKYEEYRNHGLSTFQFLIPHYNHNYAICLRDLGITELGWNPFRDNNFGNLNVIIDSTLKKFNNFDGSVTFWIDDNTSYKLYKSVKDTSWVNYSPNLKGFIEKSNTKFNNSNIERKFTALFNNWITSDNNYRNYSTLCFTSISDVRNYMSDFNAEFVSNLDIVKMLFSDTDISFRQNNSVIDNTTFSQLVDFTELTTLLTAYLYNNRVVPDEVLNITCRTDELAKYFSYYCNYGVFLIKYVMFLRNYAWLRKNNIDTSCFGVIPSLILKQLASFINNRGFSFFFKNDSEDFYILCSLNDDLKNKFYSDYIIDMTLVSNILDKRSLRDCNKYLHNPPVHIYTYSSGGGKYAINLTQSWYEVYRRMCIAYSVGDLDTVDKSLFDGMLYSRYTAETVADKLKKFFSVLLEEYNIPYVNLDFYKFALDCLTGKNIYCKTIGLPHCIMTQDIKEEMDSLNNKIAKVRVKFYTKDKENNYWLYRCSKETYIDDKDNNVYDWAFKKVWSPSLK